MAWVRPSKSVAPVSRPAASYATVLTLPKGSVVFVTRLSWSTLYVVSLSSGSISRFPVSSGELQIMTGPRCIFSPFRQPIALARHVLDVWHAREQNPDYISKILALGGISSDKGHLRKLPWLHWPLAFRKELFQERP